MYTLIDLNELQYQKGIHADDYKYIKDVDSLVEDIALDIQSEDTIILSKNDTENIHKLKEVFNPKFFQFIEDMPDKFNTESEPEPKAEPEYNIEDLGPIREPLADMPEDNQKTSLFSRPKNRQKKEVNTVMNNTIEKPEVPKKEGLFSRLFKRNKSVEEITAPDFNMNILATQLKRDYSRGKEFRAYLVENKYLTEEDVKFIQDRIKDNQRIGVTKQFIQLCREERIFVRKELSETNTPAAIQKLINKNEDLCAELLSFTTSKEIISKVVIDSNLDKIMEYNKLLKNQVNNYFIINVNNQDKSLKVCKDCSEFPNYYQLEKLYPQYKIYELNTVEGVTSEILGILGG